MKNVTKKKVILSIVAAAIALLSFFGVSNVATSTEFHKNSIVTLEDKQQTVLGLTASSAAASAVANMIPLGAGDSIGDALADLSTHFLIVLCAIFLEKILLTLTGYVAFNFLIPIACVLYILYLFCNFDAFKSLGRKLFLFGIVIFLVTPVSVKVSNLIEDTYKESISSTIEETKQLREDAESLPKQEGGTDAENASFWDTLKNNVSSFTSNVSDTFSNMSEQVSAKLNEFINHLAVMIITSCVIPILVLVFMIWFVKITFSIPLPNYGELYHGAKSKRKNLLKSKNKEREPEDFL